MSVEREAPRWSEAARMLGAAMKGLDAAMFGAKEERPGVVIDAPGEPPDPVMELLLDPDHPERSLVVFHAPPAPPAGSDC